MSGKQIDNRWARNVMLVAQQGGVSTEDVVAQFMPPELYRAIYCGWGAGLGGRDPDPITLTGEQRLAVSFALASMANTFLDLAPHVPKQRKRKGEK